MSKLLEKTKELLRNTSIPMERVAVDTGINVYTITRIRGKAHKSVPAVDTCEKIYEYLSGKELEV